MHGTIKAPLEAHSAIVRRRLAWAGGISLALIAAALVVTGRAKPADVGRVYAGDVIVILIGLDLLTRFFSELGALDAAALAVARMTRGDPRKIVWGIGMLMFFVSALLNNLAAIFTAAPIFLLILQQLGAGPRASALVLALVLVNTNLGGAATPIGDFPAIILMASGVIDFNSYLVLAFPLCLCSSLVITWITSALIPHFWQQPSADVQAFGRFAIESLAQRMQFARPDWLRVSLLAFVFTGMIVTWAVASPAYWPFHYTAIVGAVAACMIVGRKMTADVLATYDLRTTVFMAITLAGAAIAAATGVLDLLAGVLSNTIDNPILLLFAVMFATMVAAAVFQAGPAAAAMLPLVAVLASGPLKQYGDWVYVAFAGSICAGSSTFVFSATSGPALMGEAQKAGIRWGVSEYLPYGIAAASVQFLLVVLWTSYAIVPGLNLWYALIGSVFAVGGAAGIAIGAVMRTKGNAAGDVRKRNLHDVGTGIIKLSIVAEVIGIITKVATWKW